MALDRLILATRNPGKLRELRALLADLPLTVDAPPDLPEIEETGETFAENALLKARAVAGRYGEWALADDSGLEVDALGGEPGVRSARYGGPGLTDAGRVRLLLERLADAPDERRGARFRAVIALAAPDGRAWTFSGVCEGRIGREARGSGGFGYDPVFHPEGETRTMAEMTPAEKHRLSHRGHALREAARFLRELGSSQV